MTPLQDRSAHAVRGLPSTWLGRATCIVLVLFLGVLSWVLVGANTGGLEPGTLLARTLGTTMICLGLASLVAAAVSWWHLHDRAWMLVLAGALPGLVVLVAVADLVLDR